MHRPPLACMVIPRAVCYIQVPLDGTISTVLATASEPPQCLKLVLHRCKARRPRGLYLLSAGGVGFHLWESCGYGQGWSPQLSRLCVSALLPVPPQWWCLTSTKQMQSWSENQVKENRGTIPRLLQVHLPLRMWKWHHLTKFSRWRHFGCRSVGTRDPVVPLQPHPNAVADWNVCFGAALLISGAGAVHINIFEIWFCPCRVWLCRWVEVQRRSRRGAWRAGIAPCCLPPWALPSWPLQGHLLCWLLPGWDAKWGLSCCRIIWVYITLHGGPENQFLCPDSFDLY